MRRRVRSAKRGRGKASSREEKKKREKKGSLPIGGESPPPLAADWVERHRNGQALEEGAVVWRRRAGPPSPSRSAHPAASEAPPPLWGALLWNVYIGGARVGPAAPALGRPTSQQHPTCKPFLLLLLSRCCTSISARPGPARTNPMLQ